MNARWLRIAIGLLAGFVTLSAVGGGVVMLTGLDSFPLDWLEGTTFPSYTLPAHVLAIIVGGTALIALVATLRDHPLSGSFAVIAGFILMGFITIEVLILEQQPPGRHGATRRWVRTHSLRASSAHSTRLASPSKGSSDAGGSGTVWNSAFIGGAYSTAACSRTDSDSPPSSHRLRTMRGPSAVALADWQLSTLNHWHMASTVKVSVRTISSAAPWSSRRLRAAPSEPAAAESARRWKA